MAITWDQIIIENTLLAAIIVVSIYFERWLEEKARRRKVTETKKKTLNFIINDLELMIPILFTPNIILVMVFRKDEDTRSYQ